MKRKVEKAQIGSSLEILLQNRLGTYLYEMQRNDPFKQMAHKTLE